jgi:thiol:disulfide interchange protein DsbD
LPESEQFISKTTGSEIETVGISGLILWYQNITNTQPLYVLTDLEGIA